MPESLHGLSVVVTRPAHQATGFIRQLEQAGARAIPFPVIEVQAVDAFAQALARSKLARLQDFDTALFISANAVHYGVALLDTAQRGQLADLVLGAIGSKTAAALEAEGFHVSLQPLQGFTSEDFLALPEIQQLQQRQILIFRGRGGRELLAGSLQQRGAEVEYVEVYQRSRPQIDSSQLKQHHQSRRLDIIAITSSEGLLNLLAMLDNPDWIKSVPLLLGSQRMAVTARQAGFTGTLVVAENPGDGAMLAALSQWVQETNND